MGHMVNGAHRNVSKCQKMSSFQKDIKCQKFKHLDCRGGHIDLNFDIPFDGHQ